MNIVLLEADELQGGRALLRGRRAGHLLGVLGVQPGDVVRVGVIDGAIGTGRVLSVGEGRVSLELLEVGLESAPLSGGGLSESGESGGLEIELILALPRPIMLQRVLKQGTVLGVRRFHLIRSRRVEKSFFQSPVLHPDKMRTLLLEGMEQAVDTRLPLVSIHPRFKPFVEDVLPGLGGQGLIAHPGAAGFLGNGPVTGRAGQRLLLAVGPEGGWSDYELDCFLSRGFYGFTLGERILHVDTAVVALLAQLHLLHELRRKR
ncbi:MAG: 16S rRNA (uracil(1498)-N(3))-methyltransferase [Desulfobulbus sp.]|jgi:16S rRNA (uracil1498-N3)-methyltransferase